LLLVFCVCFFFENQVLEMATESRNRISFQITDDQKDELAQQFKSMDKDGSGYLDLSELKTALDICGFKLPHYKVRQMIDKFDKDNDARGKNQLSFKEFENLCLSLKAEEVSSTFKGVVQKRENVNTLGGMSDISSEGTTHSVRVEEQIAFSDWINTNLGHDPDLKHLLPIDAEGKLLYEKVKDGILLCKTINHSCPDTIDERAINKKNLTIYTKHENLTLALNSAQAIGCNVINIDAHDLSKGKPHLVLGLVWQIIRIGLFNQITLEHCPGLASLLRDGETLEDLMRLSPENILLRWVNYHMERAGTNRRMNNFTGDIKDSEIYSILLKQIAPPTSGVTTEALHETNMVYRAEIMLQQAEKIKCRSFVTPNDVVEGVYKLNVAFVANLFNNYPALDEPVQLVDFINLEETREERTYRNWMNSMGVQPYVNYLYGDLCDGVIIFQLYDIIKSGIVEWNRVKKQFTKLKAFMEKLENCNYAVLLGKQLKFSLVGIAGADINEGNHTLTLALVWQLMRAYTLSILTQLANTGHPIVEKEIVEWANKKLASEKKKTSIKSFQDSSISNGLVIIDLIDAIQPGTINYSNVRDGGNSEDNMANAKYAISMARKIGARIYALPEDITEVKPKMVMTVFACLMGRDYIPDMDAKQI